MNAVRKDQRQLARRKEKEGRKGQEGQSAIGSVQQKERRPSQFESSIMWKKK